MGNTLIIPRITGGLGNQLFIYAAARRLALVNDADLALDHISGFEYDIKYQRHYQLDHFNIPCRKATATERLEPFARLRRYLKRKVNQRRAFSQRKYLVREGIDFDPRLLNIRPKKRLYLEGVWQSESYFSDVEKTIREDLRIKPPTDDLNLAMVLKIQSSNAVAVHVRFFDEPEIVGANNAEKNYYQKAVRKIENLTNNAHYFVFSDQPEQARPRIPLPDERITLVMNNRGEEFAYADLWLMSQCKHFIIANSTFSWWGAWLSNNPAKQIIAPSFEKRTGCSYWGFNGLLPDSWIKV